MEKKDFLNYIHYFRGLAILFILGLHICISLTWGDNQVERKMLVVLFNNGTILFVFISGFLFYHLNQSTFDYKRYLTKKFQYVILPYLIVSIPAIADKLYIDSTGDHWWLTTEFAEKPAILKVLIMLGTGRHMGMFWFIPTISIIYLLSPVLVWFARKPFFLWLAPLIIIGGLFNFRFGYYANIYLSLAYFLPVYIFGIWIYRMKERLFKYYKQVIIVLASIYGLISLCEFMEWIPFSQNVGLRDVGYPVFKFNPNKLKMLIFSVLMIVLFYHWSHRNLSILKTLGDYSFGIFFTHLYVIELLLMANKRDLIPMAPLNALKFILYFLFVLVACVIIIRTIKFFLHKNSRYLIGS
jgi:hypothetical protein